MLKDKKPIIQLTKKILKDEKLKVSITKKMLDDFDAIISQKIKINRKEHGNTIGRINRSSLIRGFIIKFIAENQINED